MSKFDEYVGRYFERILDGKRSESEKCVFRIDKFDGKSFVVTEFGLYLGYSTLQLNYKMRTSFVEKYNFREISQNEYETVEYLCVDPYVTEWNNKDEPRYYRILKSNNKLPMGMK